MQDMFFLKAFEVKYNEQKNNEGDYNDDLNNFAMSMFCSLSDTNFPALEIGVYEGKTSIFMYEQTLNQNRKLYLIDNFEFVNSTNCDFFLENVLKARLKKIEPTLKDCFIINDDCESYDYSKIFPSFVYFDATHNIRSVPNILKNSPENSIFAFDDFFVSRSLGRMKTVFDHLSAGKLLPFCVVPGKLFCVKTQNFANQLNSLCQNNQMWNWAKLNWQIDSRGFMGRQYFRLQYPNDWLNNYYSYDKKVNQLKQSTNDNQ